MADGTSYITTASEQASELYKNNRDYNNQLTWQSLYNSNDASARKANTELLKEYNNASAEAYVASLQNKQALQNSGFVGQYKNEAMQAYDAQLKSDKADLSSSYQSGLSQVEEARSENESNITDALTQQAEYSAEYTNAHYDYLQYLYEDYQNGNNKLFDSTLYSKYLSYDYQRDENGNPLTDEEGNYLYEEEASGLKSWDELSMTSTDNNGEYTSIYDENGNLTQFGIDFFDQIENSWDLVNNSYYGNTSDTWTTWLKNNNADLYDWAGSYNYYNYTEAGTNAGTLRTQYGMMSTDMTYSYLERMGGMTTSQVNTYFSNVSESINDVIDLADSGKSVKKITKAANSAVDAMEQLCNDLNLSSSLEAEGFSWDAMRTQLTDIIDQGENYKSGNTSAALQGAIEIGAGAGMAVYFGAFATVAATASIVPLVGGFIMGLGLLAGGIVTAVYNGKQQKRNREAIKTNMSDMFSQFAVDLSDYKNTVNRNAASRANQIIY